MAEIEKTELNYPERVEALKQVFLEVNIVFERKDGKKTVVSFTPEEAEKIVSSDALLLYRLETITDGLEDRFRANVSNFQVNPPEWKKVALKQPQLFCQKPETLNNNVTQTARLVGVTKADLVKAALKQPQLFYQKPETLNNNVTQTARLVGVTKADFVKVALKQSSLFYQKPETLFGNFNVLEIIYGSKERAWQAVSAMPAMLCCSKMRDLKHYFASIITGSSRMTDVSDQAGEFDPEKLIEITSLTNHCKNPDQLIRDHYKQLNQPEKAEAVIEAIEAIYRNYTEREKRRGRNKRPIVGEQGRGSKNLH